MRSKIFLFLFLVVLAPALSLQGAPQEQQDFSKKNEKIQKFFFSPAMAFCFAGALTYTFERIGLFPSESVLSIFIGLAAYNVLHRKMEQKNKKYDWKTVAGGIAGYFFAKCLCFSCDTMYKPQNSAKFENMITSLNSQEHKQKTSNELLLLSRQTGDDQDKAQMMYVLIKNKQS